MVVCFKNCTEHISKILDQNVEFKRVCKVAKATIIFVPVCPSVCPHETTQLPLDGFLQNFSYIRRSVLQIKVLLKSGKNNGQFTLMFLTIMAILRSVFRIMRNFSNKLCTENKNTHFMFCKFLPENRAIYEKISKNMMEPERPQTIWSMRFAWRIHARKHTSAPMHPHTHTHTDQYVIITAFPQQQWFSWTRLRVTLYVHCLSCWMLKQAFSDWAAGCPISFTAACAYSVLTLMPTRFLFDGYWGFSEGKTAGTPSWPLSSI